MFDVNVGKYLTSVLCSKTVNSCSFRLFWNCAVTSRPPGDLFDLLLFDWPESGDRGKKRRRISTAATIVRKMPVTKVLFMFRLEHGFAQWLRPLITDVRTWRLKKKYIYIKESKLISPSRGVRLSRTIKCPPATVFTSESPRRPHLSVSLVPRC